MSDLHLYGTIGLGWGDCFTASDVKGELDAMEGDLTVHVNSGGGDAFEGVAISQLFNAYRRRTGGRVTCRVEGLAASAASYMVLTADEVVMAPGSMMMIHDPSSYCEGDAGSMRSVADTLDALAASIASQYVLKTGKGADEVRGAMAAETWFTADEAVAWGIADSVDAGAVPVAACVDERLLAGYRNRPDTLLLDGTGDSARGHTAPKNEVDDALPEPGEAPGDGRPVGGQGLRCVLGHVFHEKEQ